MKNQEHLNVFEIASFGLSLLAYSTFGVKPGQTSSQSGTVTKTIIKMMIIGAGIYYIKRRHELLKGNKAEKDELLKFKENLLEHSGGIRNMSMINFEKAGL